MRLTPASTKGLKSDSFHQNFRSTRRHNGSKGCGSENSSASSLDNDNRGCSSRAWRSERSELRCLSFAICCCLRCKDVVMSKGSYYKRRYVKKMCNHTETIGEKHPTLDKFFSCFPDYLFVKFRIFFFDCRGWRSGGRNNGFQDLGRGLSMFNASLQTINSVDRQFLHMRRYWGGQNGLW